MLNSFFPPKCVFCGEPVQSNDFKVCGNCAEKLPYNSNKCKICAMPIDTVYGEKICVGCRKRKPPYSLAFVPFKYSGEVRRAIIRYKFYGKISYAKTFAALLLIEIKKSNVSFDEITFVPIHFLKYGMRGYNQSELIAKYLSEMMSIPCKKLLKKTKLTKALSKLPKHMRFKTVAGAFSPKNEEYIKNKKILLIDDIITTGATSRECAKVLKKAGAAEIYLGAIARTE
ncbi:MAG: ComF family protein [Clostridia bacterium]|nr:ComF family protein [Clostridia bacterium]